MSKRVGWEMHRGGQAFRLEGDYSRGRPGVHTLRNGDPGWPDEPPELEITKVEAKLKTAQGEDWVDVTDLLGAVGVQWEDEDDPFVRAAEETFEDSLRAAEEYDPREEDD